MGWWDEQTEMDRKAARSLAMNSRCIRESALLRIGSAEKIGLAMSPLVFQLSLRRAARSMPATRLATPAEKTMPSSCTTASLSNRRKNQLRKEKTDDTIALLMNAPKLALCAGRCLAQRRKDAKRCRVSNGFLCAFASLREKYFFN